MDQARLQACARRLWVVAAGSRIADDAIHAALGRAGYPPPYSTVDAEAEALLPPGYELFSMNAGSSTGRWHAMAWRGEVDRFTAQAQTPTLARLSAVLQAVLREARRGAVEPSSGPMR